MVKNGWHEYKRLLMEEMKANKKFRSEVRKDLNRLNVQVGQLQIKSGIWGLIGGSIPVLSWLILKK